MSRLDPDFSEARTEFLGHLVAAHRSLKALSYPKGASGRERHSIDAARNFVERAIRELEGA
jgi:hypothetical protein